MRLAARIHGHSVGSRGATVRSPAYNTWRSMVSRCTCASDTAFAAYGGAGVTVCAEWRTFDRFLADMGDRPAGKTLDRIDNDKGYSPDNCRWADKRTQMKNRRNTRLVSVNGRAKTLTEWAESKGCSRKALESRLYNRGEGDLVAWLMM